MGADIAKVKGQERFDWSILYWDPGSLNNLPNYTPAHVILTKQVIFSTILQFWTGILDFLNARTSNGKRFLAFVSGK